MLSLGLRKTEATGLTWDFVDFKENKISIENILYYKSDDGFMLKKPKTKSSRRTLIAPIELMHKLKSERIRQNELKLKGLLENTLDLVCLNTKLKPMHSKNVNEGFDNFCKAKNIRRIKIHDLRHTNATLLVSSGTDYKTISERLGHADISITINRYSHVLEDMDKSASENIGKILFK
jgi:integrase